MWPGSQEHSLTAPAPWAARGPGILLAPSPCTWSTSVLRKITERLDWLGDAGPKLSIHTRQSCQTPDRCAPTDVLQRGDRTMERRWQHPPRPGLRNYWPRTVHCHTFSWGAGERRLLRRKVEGRGQRMQLREGRVHLQLHTSAQQEFRSDEETPPAHGESPQQGLLPDPRLIRNPWRGWEEGGAGGTGREPPSSCRA